MSDSSYPPFPCPLAPAAREWGVAALVVLTVALALRVPAFGNPVIHSDEQFYLLVGDRMLHGSLPFVDIWDRKPIGLFLLFAAMRGLGGVVGDDGVLAYQLCAWAAASATALVIWRMARMIATPAGALVASMSYLLFLSAMFCFGGQSPVYYNLVMALAALATCRLVTAPKQSGAQSAARLVLVGGAIMLAIGLAIQIKYTVVFEGGAFGLALLWRARRDGWRPPAIAGAGLLWIACALTPSVAAYAAFAAMGQGQAFIHANFLSIFGRDMDFRDSLWRLAKLTLVLIPFWLAVWRTGRDPRAAERGTKPEAMPFLKVWALAALAGFLAFGTWYDHYVAPLLVPLAIVVAPALDLVRGRRWRGVLMLTVGAVAATAVEAANIRTYGNRDQFEHLEALTRAELRGGCLYVNEGPPALYRATGACIPTRFAFPNHLNSTADVKALGVDIDAEMRRIMASRPRVVLMASRPWTPQPNWSSRGIMLASLRRDYEVYARPWMGTREYQLWRLKR